MGQHKALNIGVVCSLLSRAVNTPFSSRGVSGRFEDAGNDALVFMKPVPNFCPVLLIFKYLDSVKYNPLLLNIVKVCSAVFDLSAYGWKDGGISCELRAVTETPDKPSSTDVVRLAEQRPC